MTLREALAAMERIERDRWTRTAHIVAAIYRAAGARVTADELLPPRWRAQSSQSVVATLRDYLRMRPRRQSRTARQQSGPAST